jgi:alpha-1,3-rhamnosyltransferase
VSEHVEVVVPSYNHARYVDEALRSIFRQTVRPARLLVIDDGSTDDSPRVIERALADCPFPCELVVRPNRGLCATLNEGLAKTTGPYFAYLGSDDTWEPDRLEAGLAALADNPEAIVSYANAWFIDGSGARTGCSSTGERYHGGDMRASFLAGNSLPQSPTVLYRRSAIDRCRWNEGSRLEDYETYLRLSAVGSFVFSPQVIGSWRSHGKNASTNVSNIFQHVLEAHDRIGAELAVGGECLAKTRAALYFRYAAYFLDSGDRLTAVRYTAKGVTGAPSLPSLAKRLIKLSIPRMKARPRLWSRS